jgi:hypothetical protein
MLKFLRRHAEVITTICVVLSLALGALLFFLVQAARAG